MSKILIDRAVVEEVIATIEDSGEMMLAAIVERQDRAVEALRAALAEPVQEPDLSRCPKCNGPADNGHDREVPPNPYYCTKCMAEPCEGVHARHIAEYGDYVGETYAAECATAIRARGQG